MATDYAPPRIAPAPEVPEGWKAQWNEQYNTWFYVQTTNGQSQWDRPELPVPDGWIAIWNDRYHRYFFVNKHTTVSQWDRPVAAIYPNGVSAPVGAPPVPGRDSKPRSAAWETNSPSPSPYAAVAAAGAAGGAVGGVASANYGSSDGYRAVAAPPGQQQPPYGYAQPYDPNTMNQVTQQTNGMNLGYGATSPPPPGYMGNGNGSMGYVPSPGPYPGPSPQPPPPQVPQKKGMSKGAMLGIGAAAIGGTALLASMAGGDDEDREEEEARERREEEAEYYVEYGGDGD